MDFKALVNDRCSSIKAVLSKKEEEYATDKDRFHSFNAAGKKQNTTPEQALMGIKVKHTISIDDLVDLAENCPKKLDYNIIDAKIGDEINYLILLEGLLKKRIEDLAGDSS